MTKIDAIASSVGPRFGASPDAARAAVCLVLRAHHGDGASQRKVTALARTRAAPLLAASLRALQGEPSFWVSHYVIRAQGAVSTSGRYLTGAALPPGVSSPQDLKNLQAELHGQAGSNSKRNYAHIDNGRIVIDWPYQNGGWADAVPRSHADVLTVFGIPASAPFYPTLLGILGLPTNAKVSSWIFNASKQVGSNVFSDAANAVSHAAESIAKNPLGALGDAVQGLLNAAIPLDLLKPIPGLGSLAQMAKSYSPLSSIGQLANSALHGDLNGVMNVAKGELSKLQSVASMVPGLGTGLSTAIGAAEALINGGKPLEIALRAAYGAIPIPPGIRSVTDTVLDAVIALANGGDVTDAALTIARDRVPEGFPRDVFDTLAQVIVRHKPIAQAAGELAMHEAAKAASGVGPALVQSLASAVPGNVSALLSKLPDPTKVFPGAPANLLGVSGLLDKLPGDLQKQAAAAVLPLVKQMAPAPPPAPPVKKLVMRLPPKPAAPPRPALSLHVARLAPPMALPVAPDAVDPAASMLAANAPFNMFAPYT